jgi:chromosomal replication initiator protein
VATRVRDGVAPPPAPSAAFPLARFVEGPSNEVAVNAAREAIARPGKRYNPLVLVGGAGVGKTHLLHAIGLELARAGEAVVACLSTATFVEELIAALDGDRVDWWRARYRRATALLLDDVHLLAGKERTQEELFNLFNQFQDQDRQLVFTAPVPPAAVPGLEERIASRLAGGLVVQLEAPDRAIRRAVLERTLADQQVAPEPALLEYLADRPADSLRSLLDALQRVTTAAAAQDKPLSAAFAREVLEGRPSGRRTAGLRTSGLVVSSAGGIRSREKMVWEWPDPADRLVEDLR